MGCGKTVCIQTIYPNGGAIFGAEILRCIVTPLTPTKGSIMRFIASLFLTIILSTQAWAQTTEEAAAAAANAAFSVIEESVISEFFNSTGISQQDLEVLGKTVDIITGSKSTATADDGETENGSGGGQGQGNGKKNKKSKKNKKGKGELPPGLAKRDELPPGLAKQLEKNGRLPPGLEVRGLPDALAKQLPDPGEGRKRVVVDNDVVLIDTQTGRVLDILKDVLGSTD